MRRIMYALSLVILIVASMVVGYYLGIRHTIINAEIWTVGNESESGWEAYLTIDGETYIYDMYVG